MKKLLVLALVLGLASLASAVPVLRFGTLTAPFGTANTDILITDPVVIDIYVWGSSDLVLDPENMATGVDIAQIAVRFNDITKVNLSGALITKFTAVSGNPFMTTTVAGRAYSGTDTIMGALISLDGADAFAMTKIFKLTLDAQVGGVASFLNLASPLETFIGNSVAGTKYASSGSVTFIPEPMTMMLLGLGGLFLRRRR